MRIAFFAKSKRHTRTTRHIAGALARAGHRVRVIHERKRRRWAGARLASAWSARSVRRFRPDLVLVHSRDISFDTLDALAGRYRIALFTPDCWPSPPAGPGLELARRVDLLLTVAKGQIPELVTAGVRAAGYLAEACEPSVHYPVAGVGLAWRSQVAFIGKTDGDAASPRARLLSRVHPRFDLAVYGRGWDLLGIPPRRRDVLPRHYRLVCSGAEIVLGCDWRSDCEWYTSNRTWFTLGCGGFLLTSYSPGLEDLLENHRHLVWYRSHGECLELIAHYLERPDERRRIAAAGRAHALAHRSYDHFARDLLDRVQGRPPAFPPARRPAAPRAAPPERDPEALRPVGAPPATPR